MTGETTIFVYDAGGALTAEYSTVTPPPAPTTSYLTTDHLGSPRVITDKAGNVIARRDFMPFGEELGAGVGPRTEPLKYSYVGSDHIRKRFTGYEKDDETGLDFAEARMYQNKHGRFTAVDPLFASIEAANPQTFNRYAYTGNNPVNITDPSGLNWCQNKTTNVTTFTGVNVACGSDSFDISGRTRTTGATGCFTANLARDCHAGGSQVRFNSDGSTTLISAPPENAAIGQGQAVVHKTAEASGRTASDAASEAASNRSAAAPAGGAHGAPLSLGCVAGMPCQLQAGPPIIIDLTPGASAEEVINFVDDAATVAGFIPGLGEVADGVSVLTSLMKGDKEGVALSVAAMNPFGGQVFGALKLARKAGNAVDTASDVAKRPGIYEFPDAKSPGSTYVGQSGDVPKRINEHVRTGKKTSGSTAKTTPVLGGKTQREIAEHNRIQQLGGVRSVPGSKTSNVRNPIEKTVERNLV